MTESISNFYIVRVTLKEMKAFDGTIMTKAGTVGYLGVDDGYYTITKAQGGAQRFKEVPSKATISKYDGMPWYYRIETADVLEVYERIFSEKERTEKVVKRY